MFRRLFLRIRDDQQGQDLTEYTLLIALLALAVVGIFSSVGASAAGVWTGAGVTLSGASSAATGSAAPLPPKEGGTGGGRDDDHYHGH